MTPIPGPVGTAIVPSMFPGEARKRQPGDLLYRLLAVRGIFFSSPTSDEILDGSLVSGVALGRRQEAAPARCCQGDYQEEDDETEEA